ncbi:hypothetical protein [Legionella donaldsonii]
MKEIAAFLKVSTRRVTQHRQWVQLMDIE